MWIKGPVLRVAVIVVFSLVALRAGHASNEDKLAGKWQIVQMTRGDKRVKIPADVRMVMAFEVATHRWSITVEGKEAQKTRHGD